MFAVGLCAPKPGWWNGIHGGLKILWEKSHAGSIPAPGTNKIMNRERPKTIFFLTYNCMSVTLYFYEYYSEVIFGSRPPA